jgi:hypothetical protein
VTEDVIGTVANLAMVTILMAVAVLAVFLVGAFITVTVREFGGKK